MTNPLERLKILKQVDVGVYGKMNSFQSLAHMAKSEGMAGMMKGNGVNLVRIVPFSGLEFFFYEFYKQNLVGGYLNHNLEKLVCGGLTGMTASTITYPLDLIRTKLSIDTQAGKSQSILGAGRQIVAEGGVLALYRGLGATLFVSEIYHCSHSQSNILT